VTVTGDELEHPLASVPVTVYVVAAAGFATGLAQFEQDKSVAGDHT
jgi:hypothetical protein